MPSSQHASTCARAGSALSAPRPNASQLESGVLVKRDGDGHTGYNAGNECVSVAVESYLIEGKVPAGDLSC